MTLSENEIKKIEEEAAERSKYIKLSDKRKVPVNEFFDMINTCLSYGVRWDIKYTSKGKAPELIVTEAFCFGSEIHKKIFYEIWISGLSNGGNLFTHHNHPGDVYGNTQEDVVTVISFKYDNDESTYRDLKQVYDFILESGGPTYNEVKNPDAGEKETEK